MPNISVTQWMSLHNKSVSTHYICNTVNVYTPSICITVIVYIPYIWNTGCTEYICNTVNIYTPNICITLIVYTPYICNTGCKKYICSTVNVFTEYIISRVQCMHKQYLALHSEQNVCSVQKRPSRDDGHQRHVAWEGFKKNHTASPMYKRQVDPIFFPGPDRRYQYASPSFFLIKNLIWPPDPLNKGKIDFLLQIWAPWSFYY